MKKCFLCGHTYAREDLISVLTRLGEEEVCQACFWDTKECPDCGERVIPEEGICPSCLSEI